VLISEHYTSRAKFVEMAPLNLAKFLQGFELTLFSFYFKADGTAPANIAAASISFRTVV